MQLQTPGQTEASATANLLFCFLLSAFPLPPSPITHIYQKVVIKSGRIVSGKEAKMEMIIKR
jgi:hypothetical protein